jgi:hypothetical protein
LFGYIIFSSEKLRDAIEGQRWQALSFGVVFTFILFSVFWSHDGHWSALFSITYWLVKNLNVLAWLFALFGFAGKHLNHPGDFIKYTNLAVYPFYIMHQTILIAMAFYVINWDISISLKFSLLTLGTFGVSFILYHFLIRRFNPLRILFGMKVRKSYPMRADQ